MYTITVGHRNIEYDAAQALLDLQGPAHTEPKEHHASRVWPKSDDSKEMEQAAKLIWNCFISSKVSAPVTKIRPNVSPQFNNQSPQFSKTSPQVNNNKLQPKKFRRVTSEIASGKPIKRSFSEFESGYNLTSNSTSIYNVTRSTKPETRSVGTQTDEPIYDPYNIKMKTTIKNFSQQMKTLEAKIMKIQKENSELKNRLDGSLEESSIAEDLGDSDYDTTMHTNSSYNEKKRSTPKPLTSTNNYLNTSAIVQENSNTFNNRVFTNHNVNLKSIDKVPIGDGHASVPSRLLKHINWNSYSSATRKLLTAVFSRRVLATHSLTGKPSPAFPNKPAKKRLDPDLVNDIVQTVVERCSVPESVVRTSITTKCADESKMLRTRQNNNKKRPNKKNRENNPPSSSDSESDD